jgi:hypothetical protein
MIKGEKSEFPKKNPLHYLKSLWVSMEVFNLLGTNNTLSYLWISDITNRQYAVPNYLTSRQLNCEARGEVLGRRLMVSGLLVKGYRSKPVMWRRLFAQVLMLKA